MKISTAVDVTPTWTGLLPALVQLAEHKDLKVRTDSWTELRRMAGAADHWNAAGPELVAALEALEKACTDEGVRGMNNLLEKARAALNIARGQS